jgi:hypothetical protein
MKKTLLIIAIILLSNNLMKSDWGGFGSLVKIKSVDNLTQHEVTLTSEIKLIDGDPKVTQKGLVWSTSPNPTLASNLGKTEQGEGGGGGPLTETFETTISNLSLGTTYYIRPYSTNTDGTFLGIQTTITTIPTLPEWGLIVFGLMVAGFGGWYVWRKVG